MLISRHSTLTEDRIDSSRSRFVIESLEPGFGYTLGNSLRRTSLSSIPGAAVISIRIDGTLHEFTTTPGVKEDASDIILNIRGLVLSSEFDELATICLRREDVGAIAAADIECPVGVEIHNPDHHIATLNEFSYLEIEMIVEHGHGYVPVTPNSGGGIGCIPMDQIYSPALKVSYKVEATRAEQRTDFDKLVIDVRTRNSITAHDAVASAGKTLIELFGLARELNEAIEGIEIGSSPHEAEGITAYQTPIGDLDFSTCSYNCLKREEIHTVGEPAAHTKSDLLDTRSPGDKPVNEVKEKLVELDLALKDFPNNFDPAAVADLDVASSNNADWIDSVSAGYDE